MAESSTIARQQLEDIRTLIEKKGVQVFSLLQDLPIAMCVTDRRGFFEMINEAYCQVYGYKPAELLGKHFTIVVPDGKKALMQNLHDDFIKTNHELQGEWFVQNKEGAQIKILVSAAYVEDETATPFKVTFLVRLMESADLEKKLENVINVLSSDDRVFSDRQMLFHDLKHQLSEEFGLGDLLGMSEINPERYRRMEVMLRHDHQALNVIDILSDLLQMEKRVFVLDKRRMDLIKMIRKILMEHSHLYQEKNINFSVKIDAHQAYPTESVPFEGDEIYLELMFQNLFFYMLSTSGDQNKTEIVIRRNGHIVIEVVHSSDVAHVDRAKNQKALPRLKHLSFLVVREHGGDVTFSISRQGNQKITILLPDPV